MKRNNIFKRSWPYWVGGVLLGVLNIVCLYLTDIPLRITSAFLYWSAWVYRLLGGSVGDWFYFQGGIHGYNLEHGLLINPTTLLVLGCIVGAMIAALLASQFKVRKLKGVKQALIALVAGIIMGYGTRIALGCNIGALMSGFSSLSLHGWVFAIFMSVGTWLGYKILNRFY